MNRKIDLLDKYGILKQKDIFIFGLGKYTCDLVRMLEEKGNAIKKILDDNINEHGKLCNGIEIVPSSYIKGRIEERTEIIVDVKYYEAICAQLMDMGFKKTPIKLFDYNKMME